MRTRRVRKIFLTDPDNISVQLTDVGYCGGRVTFSSSAERRPVMRPAAAPTSPGRTKFLKRLAIELVRGLVTDTAFAELRALLCRLPTVRVGQPPRPLRTNLRRMLRCLWICP
jgi:hypothetical protein